VRSEADAQTTILDHSSSTALDHNWKNDDKQ